MLGTDEGPMLEMIEPLRDDSALKRFMDLRQGRPTQTVRGAVPGRDSLKPHKCVGVTREPETDDAAWCIRSRTAMCS